MYHVVIAEDESIIREGLSRLIDWRELDCEVVFLAEDGLSALDFIRGHSVDILITDIKMPRMNGLELIKSARDINENIVTFLVSGYGDYEYAKSAIQYSVSGYVLKPLEEEQLRELLLKAVSILEKQAQHREIERDAQKIGLKNMAMAREKLFTRVFYSRSEVDDKSDLLASLKLDEDTYYGVYLFEVTAGIAEEVKEKLVCSSENVALLDIRPTLWALVAFGADKSEPGKALGAFRSVLMQNHCSRSLTAVGSGTACQGLKGLKKSFDDAVINFNLRQANTLMLYNGKSETTCVDIKEHCNKIVSFVTQRQDGLSAYLDLVEDELLSSGTQCIKNANILLNSIYARIVNSLLSREGRTESETLLKMFGCYEQAINAIDVRRKICILKELLAEVSPLFEFAAKGKWAKEINLSIAYIEKNYYKQTIDVNEIADYVEMNPRYFSMIFKEKVGKSVMKYLIEYRVSIAKQLLMDKDLKAYQVAEMVGYDSYPYFSTLFRKVTGESPSVYSERMQSISLNTYQ